MERLFSQSSDWIDVEAGYEMIRGKDTVLNSGDDSHFGTSSIRWVGITTRTATAAMTP